MTVDILLSLKKLLKKVFLLKISKHNTIKCIQYLCPEQYGKEQHEVCLHNSGFHTESLTCSKNQHIHVKYASHEIHTSLSAGSVHSLKLLASFT